MWHNFISFDYRKLLVENRRMFRCFCHTKTLTRVSYNQLEKPAVLLPFSSKYIHKIEKRGMQTKRCYLLFIRGEIFRVVSLKVSLQSLNISFNNRSKKGLACLHDAPDAYLPDADGISDYETPFACLGRLFDFGSWFTYAIGWHFEVVNFRRRRSRTQADRKESCHVNNPPSRGHLGAMVSCCECPDERPRNGESEKDETSGNDGGGGRGRGRKAEGEKRALCFCSFLPLPLRRRFRSPQFPARPTICPWVSEDAPPDKVALFWFAQGRRLPVTYRWLLKLSLPTVATLSIRPVIRAERNTV